MQNCGESYTREGCERPHNPLDKDDSMQQHEHNTMWLVHHLLSEIMFDHIKEKWEE